MNSKDNIFLLRPPVTVQPSLPDAPKRSRLIVLSAAALAAAEMERNMCLEAAASMAEMLGNRMLTAHPALISPESVAQCLTALAAGIRDLKDDDAPTDAGPKPGAAA